MSSATTCRRPTPTTATTSTCGPARRCGGRSIRRPNMATSLFGDMPLSGEVNLLTSGAFAPGDLFSGDTVPRGVAYLSLGVPTAGGDWTVRAAMSEGDLSSWNVAGAFASRPGSHPHARLRADLQPPGLRRRQPVGARRGHRQQPQCRRGLRLRQVDGGAAADRRVRQPLRPLRLPAARRPAQPAHLGVDRAARAARASSPRWRSAWSRPAPRSSSRPTRPGPGCRRSALSRRCAGRSIPANMRVERARTVGVGARARVQGRVGRQRAALLPARRRSAGHAVRPAPARRPRLCRPLLRGERRRRGRGRLGVPGQQHLATRGSRARSTTASPARAGWAPATSTSLGARARPLAWRPATEELHDITTSLETAIPETATRVVVVYKVNTGYARVDQTQPGPGLDGRFNVQLNQALPFDFAGTRWEILVGVRNLFRDPDRSRVGLRRAPRRPPAQARRRRLPGPLLDALLRTTVSVFLDRRFQLVGSTARVSGPKLLCLQNIYRQCAATRSGERPLLRRRPDLRRVNHSVHAAPERGRSVAPDDRPAAGRRGAAVPRHREHLRPRDVDGDGRRRAVERRPASDIVAREVAPGSPADRAGVRVGRPAARASTSSRWPRRTTSWRRCTRPRAGRC